eukprot:6998122-Heterocapsa_arctica.AAC.1
MVSAGIEELRQEVHFKHGIGRYPGWNQPAIIRPLNTYKSHYTSKTGNQQLNAIIRLSLIVAQGTLCSKRSHFLLDGWQPIEPGNELFEQADPTLSQAFPLDEGVIVGNRRVVGESVAGSYAP